MSALARRHLGKRKLRFAIYGTGGCGRDVAPLTRDQDAVFVVDTVEEHGTVINGLPVISFEQLCLFPHADRQVVLAISDEKARRTLAARCEVAGLRFGTVRASTHRIYDDVHIGEGAILCDNTLITSNIRIGRHFHCNMFSYVAHDCRIGDFVTFAPRVNCNGRVIIEDEVFVGSGAILRNGKPGRPLIIGRGAVIGMGAVVTKDVPAGAVMVGNPARPIQR